MGGWSGRGEEFSGSLAFAGIATRPSACVRFQRLRRPVSAGGSPWETFRSGLVLGVPIEALQPEARSYRRTAGGSPYQRYTNFVGLSCPASGWAAPDGTGVESFGAEEDCAAPPDLEGQPLRTR